MTTNSSAPSDEDQAESGKPGFWTRWYALVLGELIALIALFYLFTKAFE